MCLLNGTALAKLLKSEDCNVNCPSFVWEEVLLPLGRVTKKYFGKKSASEEW